MAAAQQRRPTMGGGRQWEVVAASGGGGGGGRRWREVAQQAASGPTSLGATSEEGAHPQLSSGSNPSVLVDKTKSTRDGLKTVHTNSGTNEESRVDDISKKIKLEDLSEFLKDTRSAFFTPDSPQDEPIIVTDESEEEEADKDDTQATSHNVTEDTSVPPPSSLKSAQIKVLMAQSHGALDLGSTRFVDVVLLRKKKGLKFVPIMSSSVNAANGYD
ncbi:hypothetical protein Tco_0400493 [Tanacetum coccineum]